MKNDERFTVKLKRRSKLGRIWHYLKGYVADTLAGRWQGALINRMLLRRELTGRWYR